MSTADLNAYTGVENLEVMQVAVKYQRFLLDIVAAAAGPPSSGPLLDFGTGAGTYALGMRERGYEVVCVEADAGLCQRVGDLGFNAFASLDEIEPASVSTAYTLNVLEHIDDDVGALRGLHRVIRPDGLLVVYVPAFEILFTAMDERVGHVRRYRKRQLVERVEQAGFRIRRCAYADSLGFLASLAYRAVGNRDGRLNERSVALYDRAVFPVSRVLDRAVDQWFGKNVVLVAEPVPARR